MFDPVNRRRFLEQAAAAFAIGAGGSLARADDKAPARKPTVAELMSYVDPLMRPVKTGVSDADNALPLLIKAGRLLTEPPEGEYPIESCFSTRWPDAERDRRLAELLDANIYPIALVVQAAGRGKLAFPDYFLKGQRNGNLRGFVFLGHLLQLAIQRLIAEGKLAEAAEITQAMAETYRLLAGGGGSVVDYEIASTAENEAWKLMARIVSRSDADAKLVRGLLASLPSRSDPMDGMRRAIANEFCYYDLPLLLKADGAAPEKVLEILYEWHEPQSSEPARTKYRLWAKGLAQLFQGHPQPYDLIDTVRRTSAYWAGCLSDLEIPWKKLAAKPTPEELKTWPVELKFPPLKHPMVNWPPATDGSIQTAHAALRPVENPLGKVYVEMLDDFYKSRQQMYRAFQTRLEGTRALLAIRLFELQQGKAPANLDELVAAKILDAVPLDPFSVDAAQPFHYLPAERAIWSVDPRGDFVPNWPRDPHAAYDYLWWLDAARP